ncbi:hypothetical protein JTB14_028098 [Gonioctena quinquepunctata]|nr:hypothetical protein JTB14_028098 [Gonioctena quinquepunctata]
MTDVHDDAQPSTSSYTAEIEFPLHRTNSTNTVHTSEENPIPVLPIAEQPLNYYNNQVVIKTIHEDRNPIMKHPFPNRTRTTIFLATDQFETNIIKILQQYFTGTNKTAIYFDNTDIVPTFCKIIANTFEILPK